MKVLVVEDEWIVALDLQGTLEGAGHTVVGVAATIAEAMEVIGRDPPELALININLREGKGAGIDLARDLLDRHGVPALFVSGQVREARENRDAALGYIRKPWRSRTILESVEVARRLIHGEDPDPVPSELELFKGNGNSQ
jgi:CheY-like chemotaxis protein